MSLRLVDVKLYAIDRVNVRTSSGKRKLQAEIRKCRQRFPFFIPVKQSELNRNEIPMYYISPKPISRRIPRQARITKIKYKIAHRIHGTDGIDTVYGYVISVNH